LLPLRHDLSKRSKVGPLLEHFEKAKVVSYLLLKVSDSV
jgi:hypothetical protein